MQFYDVTAD